MKRYSNSKAKRLMGGNTASAEVDEDTEIASLVQRRTSEAPESGSQLQSNGELRFDMLPISTKTLKGLAEAKLTIATEIQAAALPHALSGRDILGAAKTGSGKTLSFVIPLIEKLYIERWCTDDGLAALIITPTRELALQIFEVVRIVGRKHQFSAGLITGGKKEFEGEQERVIGMNILVSTPGRLLHHFEQTVGFNADQLMVLVLDEADRILDMGFKQQLDSIVSYLPPSRQTMLFSATQTKSVKDLARLSLRNAEYVAVRSEDNEVTPKQLVQNYIVCPLHEKLDVLFSFIKTHLKSKMIIFFSTQAQVRFVYECFRGMQPGIPLVALHGKIKQERRTIIYMDYLKRNSACLIATDIAARGLDFPDVDWVIQADAPEDPAMYIHRVGRTARYTAGGRALLLLSPFEEEGVVKSLKDAAIPISKLTVNSKKTFSVATKAAALLAAQPDYRLYAKKAFTGYLRSLQLLPGNRGLDVTTLPVDQFATSLGLGFTPPVPVVEKGTAGREDVREKKNVNRSLDKLRAQIKEAKEAKRAAREQAKADRKAGKAAAKAAAALDSDEEEEEEELLAKKPKKKAAVKKARTEDSDEDDDLLQVKQVHNWTDKLPAAEALPVEDGKSKKTKKMKINMDGEQKGLKDVNARKTVFDEEGGVVDTRIKFIEGSSEVDERIARHASEVKARIERGRKEDQERERARVKEKRLKLKREINGDKDEEGDDDDDDDYAGPTLSNFVPQSDSESDSDSGSDSSSSAPPAKGKARPALKRRDATSSSSSGSDSDSDSSSSEEKPKARQAQLSSKRKRTEDTSEDSDSDSDSSASTGKGKVNSSALRKQEEMVMQMMNKRKK